MLPCSAEEKQIPIPVHIISGFLGTGKTSLIRHQLQSRRDEQLAVIVNDFGEASLDSATLSAEAPFSIENIPGGCLCCTAPEGFVDALGAVLERGAERLLIEPTGLARPQDLLDTIRRSPHRGALQLAPVVVLVDPARLGAESAAERELLALQTGVADVLVANRSDLCSDSDLARFDALAASLWPPPLAVHRTRHGRIPAALMEWPAGEGARLPRNNAPAAQTAQTARDSQEAHEAHGAHAHAHGDFAARSWRWSPELVFDTERLQRAILRMREGLAGAKLARFKGIFRTQEGFLLLEAAGGELHRSASAHRRDSRADAIFEGDAIEAAAGRAANWLAGAVLSQRELADRAQQLEVALSGGNVRILRREDLQALPGGIGDVSQLFPKRAGAAARMQALCESLALPQHGSAVVCAADGFASDSLPLNALRQGVLLHSLANAPLPADKGGPFRLMLPPDTPGAPSNCANVKCVVRIVIRSEAAG
ncbi:MAG: GTP-binding protein [Deltaproteobacteria bacterium]|nr:GTP-binding protein [Deltaproteobacteria bacterium]